MRGRCRIQLSTSRSKYLEYEAQTSSAHLYDSGRCQPIVAIEATGTEARELCKEDWFREELSLMKWKGEPLYNLGIQLRARPATEEEWVRYDEASREAGKRAQVRPRLNTSPIESSGGWISAILTIRWHKL